MAISGLGTEVAATINQTVFKVLDNLKFLPYIFVASGRSRNASLREVLNLISSRFFFGLSHASLLR